jgi:hypothetical protein
VVVRVAVGRTVMIVTVKITVEVPMVATAMMVRVLLVVLLVAVPVLLVGVEWWWHERCKAHIANVIDP